VLTLVPAKLISLGFDEMGQMTDDQSNPHAKKTDHRRLDEIVDAIRPLHVLTTGQPSASHCALSSTPFFESDNLVQYILSGR
jgi:hypothetical protein